jgi:hypothetical protein
MNTEDIAIFVFLWNTKDKSNVLEIFESLHRSNKYCYVLDATEENSPDHPNWIKVDAQYYFKDKFIKALELFNQTKAKLFLHIQGDTYFHNWKYFISKLHMSFIKYNFGVYAPLVENVCNNHQVVASRITKDDKSLDSSIYHVNLVDETVWSVDRYLIEIFLNNKTIFSAFEDNYYGWGFDEVFCALSYMNQKNVILDMDIRISHDISSGYDKTQANLMYRDMQKKLPDDLVNHINFLQSKRPVSNPKKIKEFYVNHIINKDFDHYKYSQNIQGLEDFYQPYCKDNLISDRKRLYYHWFNYSDTPIFKYLKI